MSDTTVAAFLGDRERKFDLLPQLAELERATGAATGSIVKRILNAEFHAADCPAVVRLSLIGAGESPKEAAALAATWIERRPLVEGHALATTIVLAAWAGIVPPAPVTVTPEPEGWGDLTLVHGPGREEVLKAPRAES